MISITEQSLCDFPNENWNLMTLKNLDTLLWKGIWQSRRKLVTNKFYLQNNIYLNVPILNRTEKFFDGKSVVLRHRSGFCCSTEMIDWLEKYTILTNRLLRMFLYMAVLGWPCDDLTAIPAADVTTSQLRQPDPTTSCCSSLTSARFSLWYNSWLYSQHESRCRHPDYAEGETVIQ